MAMCNLGNRLCVCEKMWPVQVIWSFDSGNKTWDIMYTIKMNITSPGYPYSAVSPLAVLEKAKKNCKLLFSSSSELYKQRMVVYDSETKSYDLAFTTKYNI